MFWPFATFSPKNKKTDIWGGVLKDDLGNILWNFWPWLQSLQLLEIFCPWLEESTFFDSLKMGHSHDLLLALLWKSAETFAENLERPFFYFRKTTDFSQKIESPCTKIFSVFGGRLKKKNLGPVFLYRTLPPCVLSSWPWLRTFLSLTLRVSVLRKSVLGLGFGFLLCPWVVFSKVVSSIPPLTDIMW